ncbi:DUF3747 domain-containing protein [Aphanothece sacrum]|uniref:SPOR domain-containing protein n=1 Tax=Aphanothece sacrum FPU1 TaxID=1920663 RepID=A0A401IF14_APHSA|nr:DUF3747 domain-containing protein [Aphanothece sacrum]GBF79863.1 hypothetical protein AsFPU1_1263 [Aphanothece sacrum FPU1]GBF83917.1 hypothetical protein AsFPU3_0961 [Aphanothece sacrum FPU3]
MKFTLIRNIVTLTTLTLISIIPPSYSSQFEQQEVQQEEFIAIARPYGENKYDLLILRQIPGQQQCWRENGSNPVLVEPLLLNFNFTGSCERSTDSNGYSIRVDGEDYGLDYLLRLVERNGELVLVGTHRVNTSEPEIVIGRTHGLQSGFMRIDLDPAWRFTRRAYGGKALSHIYLSGDNVAMTAQNPSQGNLEPAQSNSEPIREMTFTSKNQGSLPSPPNTLTSSPHQPITPSPPQPLTSLPAFSDLPPLSPPVQNNNNRIVPPPPLLGRKNVSESLGSLSNRNNPSIPKTYTPQGYRVIVAANDRNQQEQLRSLYPDAFPTSYNGRAMWQVGLFSSRENAQKAYQSLENEGLRAIILP